MNSTPPSPDLNDPYELATRRVGRDRGSHHVDSAARRRPLAAVGEASVATGGAVHVRRLQLHLAGGDGCVELHLSSVHDVEHQADADDDLRRGAEEETGSTRQKLLVCYNVESILF